jgi:hypothetical protein
VRRFLKAALTVLAIVIAAIPLALAAAFNVRHWPIEAVGGLAIVYVIWLPATVFGLIWVFDRLGFHYGVDKPRKEPSPSKRERQRGRAGMSLLEGKERARREAALEAARRRRREAEAKAADSARKRAAGGDPRGPRDTKGR